MTDGSSKHLPPRSTAQMKVLFVSNRVPTDLAKMSSGTFKRMRTFLDALRENASIRLLLYCHHDLAVDRDRVAAAREYAKSAWDLGDQQLVMCAEDEDQERGDKIWDGYLGRSFSIHR